MPGRWPTLPFSAAIYSPIVGLTDGGQRGGAMPGWHNLPQDSKHSPEDFRLPYSLKQFANDCHRALREQESRLARETIRTCCSRACADGAFVAAHFGPDNTSTRKILYEDPDLGFCILVWMPPGLQRQLAGTNLRSCIRPLTELAVLPVLGLDGYRRPGPHLSRGLEAHRM